MKLIVAAVLCIAAVVGQVSSASAQYYSPSGYYYYPLGGYYNYGAPEGFYDRLRPQSLGWNYARNQPVGYGKSYPAARMPDDTLACEHGNYRPIRGWCRPICCGHPDSP
jgi:hypothetical protein